MHIESKLVQLPKHLLCCGLLVAAMNAHAIKYQIVATLAGPYTGTSGFLLDFDDLNGDGLFEMPELTKLSQYSDISANFGAVYFMTEAPTIPGIAQESGTCVVGPVQAWCIQWNSSLGSGAAAIPTSFYTYAKTITDPVPEPSRFALMAVGLALLLTSGKARRTLARRWASGASRRAAGLARDMSSRRGMPRPTTS